MAGDRLNSVLWAIAMTTLMTVVTVVVMVGSRGWLNATRVSIIQTITCVPRYATLPELEKQRRSASAPSRINIIALRQIDST